MISAGRGGEAHDFNHGGRQMFSLHVVAAHMRPENLQVIEAIASA